MEGVVAVAVDFIVAVAEQSDGEAVVAAMLDPNQPSAAIDGDERAAERTADRILAKAGEPLAHCLVPRHREALRAIDLKQFVGGAGGLADSAAGEGDGAA